jgi:hypothetical protein
LVIAKLVTVLSTPAVADVFVYCGHITPCCDVFIITKKSFLVK